MASGITTKQQIYDILDKINDNLSSRDEYSNMKLYYNEMMNTAVIYTVLDEEAGLSNDFVILAIFNPERILLSTTEYYKGSILKNVVVSTDKAMVNDIALGGFIDYDRLINNICVSLGVKLGKNFKNSNQAIYNELRNICIKHTSSLNNSPYAMQKALTDYKSYVPYDIILDFAIYLNSLGLFNQSSSYTFYNATDNIFSLLNGGYDTSDQKLKIKDLYQLYNKTDFTKGYNTWVDTNTNFNSQYKNTVKQAFNAMITEYEDEIDWSRYIISATTIMNRYQATIMNTYHYIMLITIPTNCYYRITEQSNNTAIRCYNDIEDFTIVVYKLTYEVENDIYTYSKNTYEGYANTDFVQNMATNNFLLSNIYTNIIFNKYIKFYSNNSNIPYEHYSNLTANTWYNNIKFMPDKFICALTGYKRLSDNNISFSENDFVIANGNYFDGTFAIFRNVKKLRIGGNNAYSFCNNNYNKYYLALIDGLLRYRTRVSSNYDFNATYLQFDFDEQISYEIYTWNSSTQTYTVETGTTSSFIPPSSMEYSRCNNIGEVVEMKEPEELTDMTLESGATYPRDVIDNTTFVNTMGIGTTWDYTQSKQPKIEDGEIVNNTTNTLWLALDVGEPSSQSQAQTADLDNVDVDTLIRDIDKAEEDDDTDDKNDDDDDDGSGSVDEDDILDVINPINTDFLKIEAYEHTRPDPQTPSQIEQLHDTLCTPNIWNAIKALIANPMDGIISLIGMYDGLWNNPEEGGIEHRTVPAIFGIELTGCTAIKISNCNMEKDLGYVNIDSYFDNYTDITERVLSIYLPFVGEIPLNVRDFNNRKIRLKVRTECMTGIIIYNIYTPELDSDGNPKYNGDKECLKLIKSVSGNCAIEIPIKSDIKTGLLRNLAGGNWTF